jgi:hypothetical protein
MLTCQVKQMDRTLQPNFGHQSHFEFHFFAEIAAILSRFNYFFFRKLKPNDERS